jgi:hypothetical protein
MTDEITAGGFEFDGLRARAESSHAADLEWLEEFLCPQFQRVDAASASCVVRFTRDPLRFEFLLESRRSTSESVIDCFALDQQVIRLPSWTGPGGATCILDEKFHSVYVLDSASSEIEIVASTMRRGPRIPAMRVLREFAMNHSLGQGHLFIHGSAVAIGEAGILIAGPSGAGKTTLLLHLLSLGNAVYLSNDRVLARSGPEGMLLTGMPAITTLRSSTLDLYPSVREALTRSPWNHYRTISESEQAATPIRPWTDARYGLTPAQFCRLMGVQSRATAVAKVVLMPRQTHGPGHITLTRLTPDAVEHRLRAAIFGIGCWSHETNVFALPADRTVVPAQELHRRCHRFAATLPVFDCALGQQAYDDPAATQALLAEWSG